MYKYNQSLNAEPKPASKRWQTTTSLAMMETAAALKNIDRADLVDDSKQRRHNNTKSSINFGNNKIEYVSDMMDNQRRCQVTVDPVERDAQKLRIKMMKADLTATSFSLGTDKPEYESINHLAMAEANNFNVGSARAPSRLGKDLVQQIRNSSISFGNEPTNYNTIAHDAMEYRGNTQNFEKTRKEIQTMKANLRKHNFNFGDDQVDYTSDYKRGYSNVNEENYKLASSNRTAMAAIKQDLRATHWVLGHEKVNYLSDTHEALRSAEGESRAVDVQQNLLRAKQMKQELQKTSYIIGTDDDYK